MRLKYILLSLSVVAAHAQNIAVQVGGKPVGVETALNFLPGAGIVQACLDNQIQQSVDCTRPSIPQ